MLILTLPMQSPRLILSLRHRTRANAILSLMLMQIRSKARLYATGFISLKNPFTYTLVHQTRNFRQKRHFLVFFALENCCTKLPNGSAYARTIGLILQALLFTLYLPLLSCG